MMQQGRHLRRSERSEDAGAGLSFAPQLAARPEGKVQTRLVNGAFPLFCDHY